MRKLGFLLGLAFLLLIPLCFASNENVWLIVEGSDGSRVQVFDTQGNLLKVGVIVGGYCAFKLPSGTYQVFCGDVGKVVNATQEINLVKFGIVELMIEPRFIAGMAIIITVMFVVGLLLKKT